MDPGGRPLPHRHLHAAGGGGREDCWSDGATAALINAWGDRHLRLSRGSLRQKDWKEVAHAVNERQETVGKPPKTDSQCKNRIDTLKKKYKIEKAKPGPSQWSFFSRLDLLIGDAVIDPYPRSNPFIGSPYSHRLPKKSLSSIVKHQNPNPGVATCSSGSSKSSPGQIGGWKYHDGNDDEDGEGDAEENEDGDEEERKTNEMFVSSSVAKRQRNWGVFGCAISSGVQGVGAFGELARAIMKFADVYERVENSKQQQMMEMERKRMEFVKDLEFQRMQMLMDAQIEVEKMKRPKNNTSGSGTAGYSRMILKKEKLP